MNIICIEKLINFANILEMKTFFIIGFLSCVGIFGYSQSISIKEKVIDYGSLKKGANGLKKVEIKNDGDKPLIISQVKSTCGCTIPEWPKTPIMPGKSNFITIEYDTKKVGPINKMIEIFSNDPKLGRKTLKIKGEIL